MTNKFIVYENNREIEYHPTTLKECKGMIAGLDESMACVDCDYQEYTVVNAKTKKVVYHRPAIHTGADVSAYIKNFLKTRFPHIP